MEHYAFAGGSAVVTGAASGIGEALAAQLADRGSNLVLVDRDEQRLVLVAERLRAAHPGLSVATHVADLSDEQQTDALATTLATEHPETTLLVNNAGVALGGRFDQVTLEEFDWVMAVNFRSVVRLTHALLPVLKAHPGAHLVKAAVAHRVEREGARRARAATARLVLEADRPPRGPAAAVRGTAGGLTRRR